MWGRREWLGQMCSMFIDNEEIPMVEQYKYLGCVVDEHLELKDMVEKRVLAGRKALGARFH